MWVDSLPARHGLLIVALATLIAFSPVLWCDFTSWDDYETVARNPLLNPPRVKSLEAFWTRPHGDLYVPVTYSMWWIAAQVALPPRMAGSPLPKLSPHVFHALNLMLHVAAACVVLMILQLLVRNAAAAAVGALLFALHPVQVESVAWVSGMKDVLFGLLSLIAIWQYLVLATREPRVPLRDASSRWRYGIATVVLILAMLAKPTAMVVPFVVIVIDRMLLGRPAKQVMRLAWPWVALAIPCAVIAKLAQPAEHIAGGAAPLWARPLIAADAIAFYLYKLVFPAALAIDYGRTPLGVIHHGWIFWTWLIPVALAVGLWWLWKRGKGDPTSRETSRSLLAGGLFMLIVLLPVLGFTRFDFQAYSTVADHYLYLAMLGVALAAAAVIARWPSSTSFVISGIVLVMLGARTFAQTRHWRDADALFTHTLAVNPASVVSYNSLSALAVEEGRPADALALSRRAIEINPYWAGSYLTFADAARMLGRSDDALAALRNAVEVEPDFAAALNNLAVALAERGQLDQAAVLAKKAVELKPDDPSGHITLGTIEAQQDRIPAAIAEYNQAVELSPLNPKAHTNLGYLLAATGHRTEAAQHYRTALESDPTFAPAKAGLAQLSQPSPP